MTANPLDQIVGMAVFLAAFCFTAYFLRAAWRAYVSPEFKRDLSRLRDQRRKRRDARREK